MSEPSDTVDPVALAQLLTPADPAMLKMSFSMLVDSIIRQCEKDIIDWETVRVESRRYLNEETGQTLIKLAVAVKVMEVGSE